MARTWLRWQPAPWCAAQRQPPGRAMPGSSWGHCCRWARVGVWDGWLMLWCMCICKVPWSD